MITRINILFIVMLMFFNFTAAKPLIKEKRIFWKRTSDAELDLNRPEGIIPEHYNQIINHSQNSIQNSNLASKRKLLTPEERKERRKISKRKYQKKKEKLVKEARKDKTKITPSIEKFIQSARNRTKRYHDKIGEIVRSGNATDDQLKIFHSRKRSKFWRGLNPANERSYQAKLERERANRIKREDERKLKIESEPNEVNEIHQVRSRKRKPSELLDFNVPAIETTIQPVQVKAKRPKFDLNLPSI